jgi:hypothetical protein
MNTCLERYGVTRPLLLKEIRDKCKETMLERYGKINPMQIPQFFHKAMKSAFTKKEYILPKTQRKLEIMGYEGLTINSLLSKIKEKFIDKKIEEDDILVGYDIPNFEYTDNYNKRRVYYPDIAIKNTNLIIEVKSTYTFNLDPIKNVLKFKQVATQGYIMKVMIYVKKGLFDIWYFVGDKCLSMKHKDNPLYEFDKPLVFKSSTPAEEDIDDISREIFYNEIEQSNFLSILLEDEDFDPDIDEDGFIIM